MQFIIAIRFTGPDDGLGIIRDYETPLAINLERDDINRLINVKWLRSLIRSKVPQCAKRRLRLIYSGRVLTESTSFEAEVIRPRVKQYQRELQDGSTEDRLVKVYIHCLVGDELTAQQLEQENKLDQQVQTQSTTPEPVGFDRLLDQGFSQLDVQDFRRQFQAIYTPNESGSTTVDQINDLEEEESRQNNIRQLEQRWIESTITAGAAGGGDETTRENSNSTRTQQDPQQGQDTPATPALDLDESRGNEDLLLGLFVGIFLGVLSIVFLTADETVFNKRQRISIIAGLFVNFSFSIIRGQWV